MSNSSLISYTRISPHRVSPRNHIIDTVSIHVMAGDGSIEGCGEVFQVRVASSNYGIGSDGRIALYVDEGDRSICTSSGSNDNRAVTIEVANCDGAPDWPISDKAYEALILLLTDICQRNGIKKLLWEADKSLIGQVDRQNMTVHRWFAAKACPGNYLYNLHGEIANRVNINLEEDEDMDFTKLTDEQVDALLARVNTRLADEKPSEYAVESCEKAVKSGLFSDGDKNGLIDNPQGFLRREEAATLFNRAGLLDK